MKLENKKYVKLGITVFILFLAIYYWAKLEKAVEIILFAFAPLFAGLIIAYIVNLPMAAFEKLIFGRCKSKFAKAIKRPVSLILAVAAVVLVVFIITTMIVPELISCVKLLIDTLPPIFTDIYNDLNEKYNISQVIGDNISSSLTEIGDWKEIVEKALNIAINGVGGVMNSVFAILSAVFSTVFSAFIAVATAAYLLLGKEKWMVNSERTMKVIIPEKLLLKAETVLSVFNNSFKNFIVGQCTEAVILGGLCIIGMTIFGFPYATMIGALIGFTALIPIVGAFIGAGIGAFMILTSASPLSALLFIVFILVLQQIEGNIIYPRIVGEAIGLPAVLVLAAITIGGAIWGIMGMLIFVPIVAALYRLISMFVSDKEQTEKEKKSDNPAPETEENKTVE